MSAHMGTDDRVRLMCNHGSCIATFSRNHVSANATRKAAAKSGWSIGTRDDRRDFCPSHGSTRVLVDLPAEGIAASMTGIRSGELFAGVGGLGMAVDEVFGSEPAWFAEFDAAPSKVLAHRYPNVPNFGDVTKIDFRTVPHTQIRCGGFPCTDVSIAGARKGMKKGTRSGLWSEFARSIAEDRPEWVVIENVRGLFTADATGDVEPCSWCVGDGAEQHTLRALDAVLADLSDLGFDAEWTGIRASDVGAPHGRFRVFILAWPRERTAADASSSGRLGRSGLIGDGRNPGVWGEAVHHSGDRGAPSADPLTLLPTPAAMSPNDGEGTGTWLARRERVKATGVNDNGMGMPLSIAVQLLPTPRASDSDGGTWVRESTGNDLRTEVTLLPTPAASLGEHRRDYGQPPEARRAGGHSVSTADAARGIADAGADWGPYADAIRRWEAIVGRPAPAPVRFDGKGGKPRLNPELTEWMMGWPLGWVTAAAIGLTRAEQLKACGNGVVPQQAAAALRELLARPGVPAIDWGLAA